MYQIAFTIFFLYIRSFKLPKYPKDFDDGKKESKPSNKEFNTNKFTDKEEEKVLKNLGRVESNYFLERRTFL